MEARFYQKPFFAAVVWTLFVTYLSTTSRLPNLPKFDLFSADKIAHFSVYAIMVVLLARGFSRQKGGFSIQKGLFSVAFASFWGAAMELWQSFLPYRSFELDDEIANISGAFLGWAFSKWLLKY